MNTSELLKGTFSGIVLGFSIGVGFVLAQRVMGKKAPKVAEGDSHSNFSESNIPLNTTDRYIAQPKQPNNWDNFKPNRPESPFGNIDFTTGRKW